MDIHKTPRLVSLERTGPQVNRQTIRDMKRYHDAIHGIAWWRIMKGPGITPLPEDQ
ncbi:MAG TPA: hypothetical protein PLV84_04120 [Deltaproteobacteria bacterium]|nr:hypothetical protein [Deltaproteobacteria bacterium]